MLYVDFTYSGWNVYQFKITSIRFVGESFIGILLTKRISVKFIGFLGSAINGKFNGKAVGNDLSIKEFENITIGKFKFNFNFKFLSYFNFKFIKEGNNINQINIETFDGLEFIEMLDLSSNHLMNWYSVVFKNNPNLRLLNLRNNNINLLTQAMQEDFSTLRYLALGNNDFICDCEMRDFLDRAISNSRQINCTTVENELPTMSEITSELVATGYEAMINGNHTFSYNIRRRVLQEYLATVNDSYENILETKRTNVKYNLKIYDPASGSRKRFYKRDSGRNDKFAWSQESHRALNFTYQLLDFNETNYRCINVSSSNQYYLTEIENCIDVRSNGGDVGDIQMMSKNLIIVLSVFVFILVMFLVIYYKWWYVRYFFVIIKNATILSYLDKEKINQVADEVDEEAFTYDVFVSYCDENRDWIIEELLPNIEHHRDIKVCLHERNFQVICSVKKFLSENLIKFIA